MLQIKPTVDFTAGLKAPSPPINFITLCLLEKARLRRGDAGIVAGDPGIVAALIELWLSTPDTAVAQKAHQVFLGLLLADEETQVLGITASKGQQEPYHLSLMWRRVFRDKDIYGSLFKICSLTTVGQQGQLNGREKTIAQARLMDLLAKIDCESVRSSSIPEVEQQYGVKNGGLLEFAAVHMVNFQDDVLMHMTLIDFYAELLARDHSLIRSHDLIEPSPHSSFTLDFLIQHSLHSRTLSYYLEPSRHDSIDISYLYSRSANYLSTYCSNFPAHFLSSSPSIVEPTISRLTLVFSEMSSGHWAQNMTPRHDLHVLASIPRKALLPQPDVISPLFLVPCQWPNADALHTLASVFQGPKDHGLGSGRSDLENGSGERSAARALYFLYLNQHPDLWKHVVRVADSIALKDAALAAIALIGAVITASWLPLTAETDPSLLALPSENELAHMCHSAAHLPPSGVLALLASPALESVIPNLLRPAQTFSNLVGGGKGDVESAVYKVAAAKFDTLVQLSTKLKEVVAETGQLSDVSTAVDKRLAQGILGGSNEAGSRVGTLEL